MSDYDQVLLSGLIDSFAQRLDVASLTFGHGAVDAWGEAELLVYGFLDGRSYTESSRVSMTRLLERRIKERIPVAYLTGKAWFAGNWFVLDPGVMIPRSPIAEIIGSGFYPWIRSCPESVLDLCCGSGCLGIATALQLPSAHVVLSDIDNHALDCARKNVTRFGLSDRVEVKASSLFDALALQEFDVVLANPPYVPAAEFDELPKEYDFEPKGGLNSGIDGLDCWRRILREIQPWLSDKGILVGEVGNGGVVLSKEFPHLPFVWPDMIRAERLEDGGFGVFVLDAAGLSSAH